MYIITDSNCTSYLVLQSMHLVVIIFVLFWFLCYQEYDSDDDKYADHADMPGQKFDTKR